MGEKLFSTWKIKNLNIKNRVVMAPMDQYSATLEGKVTQWHYQHYVSRAIGQVGLIIIECSAVCADGKISDSDLGIYSDEHIEGLKSIVDACHHYGSKVIIQLGHSGRKSECTAKEVVAPSAIAFSKDYKTPREMNAQDIQNVIESFKQAGIRALKAGFDGIEVHGAHGYLISEFLSPLSNTRNDAYGKDRAKFLREILEALKSALPRDFLISLRISARDYHQDGNDIEDFVALLSPLKHLFDLLNVSTGGVVPVNIKTYSGYQIECARILREKLALPCISGGLITDAFMANHLISSDVLDGVFLARELLINPYWAIQAALMLKQDIELPMQYERARFLYS